MNDGKPENRKLLKQKRTKRQRLERMKDREFQDEERTVPLRVDWKKIEEDS